MRLEHQVGLARDTPAEPLRLVTIVVDHLVMIELHPRLHHQAHYAGPHGLQAFCCECRAMRLQCNAYGLRVRDFERFETLGCASRLGDFGSYDIARRLATCPGPGFLCFLALACCPGG